MIHIALPLALTFQIVGCDLPYDRATDDESGADVGAGPAQSISFDHVSDHPSWHVQEHLQFRRRHGFPRASGGAPGITMITSSLCVSLKNYLAASPGEQHGVHDRFCPLLAQTLPGDMVGAGKTDRTRYGLDFPSMLLTASYMATCRMAKLRVE
jgi:hypothetical protein